MTARFRTFFFLQKEKNSLINAEADFPELYPTLRKKNSP